MAPVNRPLRAPGGNWRVATIATQTVDEYGVLFRNLFAMEKIEVKRHRRDRYFFGGAAARFHAAPGLRTLLQHQATVHRTRSQDGHARAL